MPLMHYIIQCDGISVVRAVQWPWVRTRLVGRMGSGVRVRERLPYKSCRLFVTMPNHLD